MKENNKAKKAVIAYYDTALKESVCAVNFWYDPHVKAYKELKKQGILKDVYHRGIYLGTEYKGYLFGFKDGTMDCDEILIRCGKLEIEGKR